MRERLREAGYSVSEADPALDVAIKFFNVQLRNIKAQPRKRRPRICNSRPS